MKARKLFKRLLNIFPSLYSIHANGDGVYCSVKGVESFFIPVDNVEWSETKRYTIEDYKIMVGIAFECLGLSWKEVAPDYKYMAMDECGDVYVYRDKPHRKNLFYKGGGQSICVNYINKKQRKNVKWKECLWERPEVVK